jgi:hypothetical protein
MRNAIADAVLFAVFAICAALWVGAVSTSQGQSIDRAHAVLKSR